MKKSMLGSIAIILGSLVLSLQLYGLKLIQVLEMQGGSWLTNPIDYIEETPILFAICITIGVIIYGIILVVGFKNIKKTMGVESDK